MKEICKNCVHVKPSYKGSVCEIKKKKVKQQDSCENWRSRS